MMTFFDTIWGKRIRTLCAIIFGFGFSYLLVKDVFIGYSPQIRPNLPQYAYLRITDTVDSARIAFFGPKRSDLAGTPNRKELASRLSQTAPGIRGSQYKNASYNIYDLNDVEWKVVGYTFSDGSRVRVRFPRNENVNISVDALETVYNAHVPYRAHSVQ